MVAMDLSPATRFRIRFHLFFFLPKYRRAPADFNITHSLTINYLWNIPRPSSWDGRASHFVKGWQLGGIMEVKSGLPFTPLIGGDPLGLGNSSPFAYPDRIRGGNCVAPVHPQNANGYININCFSLPAATPAIAAECVPFMPQGVVAAGTCQNLLGNSGRNAVYGPGLVNFDFSLVKDTHFGEKLNAEFRAEIFNIFNRANFNPPWATLCCSEVMEVRTARATEPPLRLIRLQPAAGKFSSH